MKNIIVFLDTNVIIDYLQGREPFCHAADKIVELCVNRQILVCISAQSIADIFYILRKDYTIFQRKNLLLGICDMFNIVGANKQMVIDSLKNDEFSDLEDCIQSQCAKIAHAEYIITRNIKDFAFSEVTPILPEDFLGILNIEL